MIGEYGNELFYIGLVLLAIGIVRELTCWYFKFNKIVALLSDMRDLLKKQSERG